jgi:hypothetical protein
MALFRREAMAGRSAALEGAVSLAVPLSWQIVGGLLFAAVAGAALFLTLARTDRVLALETTIGDDGRAVAILPQSDAALLPAGACGAVAFPGDAAAMRACAAGRDPAASHLLASRDVVTGQAVRLRLAAAAPPGARGTARFVIGRESLWASLAR